MKVWIIIIHHPFPQCIEFSNEQIDVENENKNLCLIYSLHNNKFILVVPYAPIILLSCSILQALSPDDYRRVMKLVETAILSTDLAIYFKKKNKFLELIDNGEFDWQSDDKKECKFRNQYLGGYNFVLGGYNFNFEIQTIIRIFFTFSYINIIS